MGEKETNFMQHLKDKWYKLPLQNKLQ